MKIHKYKIKKVEYYLLVDLSIFRTTIKICTVGKTSEYNFYALKHHKGIYREYQLNIQIFLINTFYYYFYDN